MCDLGDLANVIGGFGSSASSRNFDTAEAQWEVVGSFYGADEVGADGSDCGAVVSEAGCDELLDGGRYR